MNSTIMDELEELNAIIIIGRHEVSVNYTTAKVKSFQYAPVSSAEVEWSFLHIEMYYRIEVIVPHYWK